MSDSDKDTSAAIDKVVGAFRAQREQGKTASPEADSEPKREPTPVTKLDEPAPTPQGGGGSEAPTKAFKSPLAAAASTGADSADSEPAESDAPAADAPATDTADGDAADGDADGLREENVVGEQLTAEPSDAAPAAAEPSDEKSDLVEQSIDLPADADEAPAADADGAPADERPAGDSTPTETISADQVAAAAAAAEAQPGTPADESPTTQMTVPAAAAAAAATGAAATAAPTAGATPENVAPAAKPEPHVVPPAQPLQKKRKTGKLVAILLAVVVVIAVVAVGLWYLLVGSSDQNKVADVAKDFQNAMNSGDLDALRNMTCGEKQDYYSKVSDEEFKKAFDAQKARNQLMTFDDVKAVQINGDTARVGVDIYPRSDPSKTAPAQITLHKVGDDWKVCTKP